MSDTADSAVSVSAPRQNRTSNPKKRSVCCIGAGYVLLLRIQEACLVDVSFIIQFHIFTTINDAGMLGARQ
jgi:hypothetical protein